MAKAAPKAREQAVPDQSSVAREAGSAYYLILCLWSEIGGDSADSTSPADHSLLYEIS